MATKDDKLPVLPYAARFNPPGAVLPFAARQPFAPAVQPAPAQPFQLNLPQPQVYVPPMPKIDIAGQQRAPAAAPRQAAVPQPTVTLEANGLPKGVPSNAIPVIRGMDLTYDIPGTGQRLYPTLEGGVSELSPEQRAELSRYTEPARIGAESTVKSAGIRAGADVASTLGAARIAQEGAKFRTLAELGSITRPMGTELGVNPNNPLESVPLTTYGLPKIGPTGAIEGFQQVGPAAQRAQARQTAEGAIGTDPVSGIKAVYKNGKWVPVGK